MRHYPNVLYAAQVKIFVRTPRTRTLYIYSHSQPITSLGFFILK